MSAPNGPEPSERTPSPGTLPAMADTAQRVRFGAYLPAYHAPDAIPPSAQFLASYAQQAETLGFDSLWVIDHLFVSPPSYRVAFLDPLIVLSIAAAVTERVTLGTGILVLPLRDPVLLAKALATIDMASSGRLIFGAGVGWNQEELDACQITRSTRGRRMDEMLDIIRGLWMHDSFSYDGEHFVLRDVRLVPRPLQKPRPPIWLAAGSVPSGTSPHITAQKGYSPERSLRRVACMGDALMSAYRSVPDGDTTYLARDRATLDRLAQDAGRAPKELTHAIQDHMYITLDGSPAEVASVVERFTYRPFAEIAPYYLLGTPDAIIPRIQARIAAGIREIAINFIDRNPQQLELFARYIRPYVER